MSTNPAQLAIWYEDAAKLLGLPAKQILEELHTKVCFKRELAPLVDKLGLGQEAKDRLEEALPGERGRG
jgi:hypothetical protein